MMHEALHTLGLAGAPVCVHASLRSFGVVCVFDSQSHKLEENLLSLRELTNVLRQRGCSLATFPIVLQYNKRDVPGALSRERLDHYLNPRPWPVVEAVATRDQGVMETFRLISSLVAAQETGRD
jgi:signal recognition particle receptor subunit beta